MERSLTPLPQGLEGNTVGNSGAALHWAPLSSPELRPRAQRPETLPCSLVLPECPGFRNGCTPERRTPETPEEALTLGISTSTLLIVAPVLSQERITRSLGGRQALQEGGQGTEVLREMRPAGILGDNCRVIISTGMTLFPLTNNPWEKCPCVSVWS